MSAKVGQEMIFLHSRSVSRKPEGEILPGGEYSRQVSKKQEAKVPVRQEKQ